MDTIRYFRGEYDFLSNFFRTGVLYDGLVYPSSENAFQAAKSVDLKVRVSFTNPEVSSAEAKRMGKIVPLRLDWEVVKDDVMLEIVRSKFKNPRLRARLSRTSTQYLFEGNNWHDTYWGVCDGRHTFDPAHNYTLGLNKLGKILERVRFENWTEG